MTHVTREPSLQGPIKVISIPTMDIESLTTFGRLQVPLQVIYIYV